MPPQIAGLTNFSENKQKRPPFPKAFSVIRLDFVPFGYFLALSVSFPRPYALS